MDFLFDFAVDPSPETANVDELAAALAFTRSYQGIIFSFLFSKTDFASASMVICGLSCFESSVGFLEVVCVSETLGFYSILHFDNHELHSAELNNVSRF